MPLPKRTADATYLGDGVYADIEGGMVRLTTEDGISATNTIYLEPDVMHALQRWYGRILERTRVE